VISSRGTRAAGGAESYNAIYLRRSMGPGATAEAEVASQQGMNRLAQAGIMVSNDMAGPGRSPEGVALFESPSGGIQMEWGGRGNSVVPPGGTDPASLPVYLMLQRLGAGSYRGYFSYNGSGWLPVGTALVPGQAPAQDSGVFVTSAGAGPPATVSFGRFSVTTGAAPPRLWTAPPPCFSLSCP
jgi:alpha-galactosidase